MILRNIFMIFYYGFMCVYDNTVPVYNYVNHMIIVTVPVVVEYRALEA